MRKGNAEKLMRYYQRLVKARARLGDKEKEQMDLG